MDTIIMLIIFIILASIGFWAVDGCYKLNEKEGREKEMKKIYKGYELLKAIADGEIKEGSRFKVKTLWNGSLYTDNRIAIVKYKEIVHECGAIMSSWTIINSDFELIEDNTIDIESINELETYSDDGVEFYDKSDIHKIAKKTNEILQAVKQLNKEIKSIKEK